MGRSNNQRRRTCKDKGIMFVPKLTKSTSRNMATQQRVDARKRKGMGSGKKLAYNKVVGKGGQVKKRIFRSGGYNNSGKFGRAKGAKALARKGK